MDPLVSTSWLADNLDDPSVVIIDATWFMPGGTRDARVEHGAGHIPGAVFFGIDEIRDHGSDLPHMASPPSEFAVAARRLGVSSDSSVVVYDGHGLFSAPRVWWNFRAMGHARSFVLDGGLPRWIAEGRPIETGWRDPRHGNFKSHPDPNLVRDVEAVRRAVERGEPQLVDARPAERFTGAAPEPRAGLRSGHMPGSRNVPWATLIGNDGSLLDAKWLRGAFSAAGVDLDKPIVTTCGSGVSAALLALALARVGRTDVAVYDGSWTEWAGRTDTPVAASHTAPAPEIAVAGRATRIIHSGQSPRAAARTVGPAIEKGSTVLLPRAAALYDESLITYGRGGLGAQNALIEALCELEAASCVRLFPSGLAAMTGAMLAVLKAGDEVLASNALYKPTRRFCDRVLGRFGVDVRYYRPRIAPEELLAMAGPATRLIVLESPGSLTFEMIDAPGVARLAKRRGILTLMDNTWAAGLHFKPLDHGIDLSIQALTKYVGGHSDVFMGAAAARDPDLAKALDEAIWDFGWSVAPEDAYQMLRGLRTLVTRLERHDASARQVATWLANHQAVASVLHPALNDSPDHGLWSRDYTGAAGLFGVVLKPCATGAVHVALDTLRVFGLGFSWGGFESLALDCDPQLGVRRGSPHLGGPLLRLNIGLEDPEDLIADLDRSLEALAAWRPRQDSNLQPSA